ncbi:zinc finger protein-like 1 [Dendroctonus ponderosae]|uniref:Zinc finger protein-like 1 homolog n=1 Tax=Dendroctonus ponderosae TaxID=77166 RepID=J3JZ48_DENPD|nr:zinc finger protein-like 1 [Dendroctonus ponderosae]AEE63486.1 unknown [Dendroctonus ponderosae]
MGLCKCPKRQVTNQFCFEHRVCVCESCMVTNHPICVVQSYLQWLQDSDYNSICELCSKDLHVEDSIRLTCYHVFHWSCLDHHSRQLPPTTAPRGYVCPSCKSPLFPAPNLISPVADVLKEKLAGVNWARAGLGLPLLSEEREVKSVINHVNSSLPVPVRSTPSPSHSVVTLDDHGAFNRIDNYHGTSSNRKHFQDIRTLKSLPFDHDENKYKRRPLSEFVSTWWRVTFGASVASRGHRSKSRRYCMLGTLVFLAVLVFFLLMSRLGRYSTENDPNFEEINNPFVNVEK